MNGKNPALKVHNLSVTFGNGGRKIPALSQFSCEIFSGETVAIIGESGCGKSVAAHAILRLLPKETEISGSVFYKSSDLLNLSEREMQRIRGRDIGLLFQSPDRSLNPVYSIKRQIMEPLRVHNGTSDHVKAINNALKKAGFSNPHDVSSLYPCMCSGGMNQRAAFAIVSALNPNILIADEPTKGLDVARVADIKECLSARKIEEQTILLITHDIGLARSLSEKVLVMYSGEVVESGPTEEILDNPMHPYTISLLDSLPSRGFIPIPGYSPPLSDLPSGCRFYPRCMNRCENGCSIRPELTKKSGREVRCHQI